MLWMFVTVKSWYFCPSVVKLVVFNAIGPSESILVVSRENNPKEHFFQGLWTTAMDSGNGQMDDMDSSHGQQPWTLVI
jgi:hypothetical protein